MRSRLVVVFTAAAVTALGLATAGASPAAVPRTSHTAVPATDVLLPPILESVATNGTDDADPGSGSTATGVSNSGRYVAFTSTMFDLTGHEPAPITGVETFVRDNVLGTTQRVDGLSPANASGVSEYTASSGTLAEDGSAIAMILGVATSDGRGDRITYVRDLPDGSLTQVNPVTPVGEPYLQSDVNFDANLDHAVWIGYGYDSAHQWVYGLWEWTRSTDSTVELLDGAAGQTPTESLTAEISPDGSTIAFEATPSTFDGITSAADIFVMPADGSGTPTPLLTNYGTDSVSTWSGPFRVSDGGRFITFTGSLPDCSARTGVFCNSGPAHIWQADRESGTVRRLDIGPLDTSPGMRPSAYLDSVSDDGSKVTYYYEIDYSTTDNELGPFDDYELLYDRGTGATEPVETAGDDTFVSGQYDGVNGSVLSGNGKYLTFTSTSPDAAAGDLNTGSDAYEEAFTGAPLTYLYAKASTHGLTVHWKNPKQFTRVTVRMRAGKVAPKCSTCGHAVYRGRGATAKIHKLRPGKHYTVAVFTHLNKKLISRKVYVATTKRS